MSCELELRAGGAGLLAAAGFERLGFGLGLFVGHATTLLLLRVDITKSSSTGMVCRCLVVMDRVYRRLR